MMKKIALSIVFLSALNFGFGQIIYFDFDGNAGNEVSDVSDFNDVVLTTSTITRGAGLSTFANNNSFTSRDWSTTDIPDAVSNNDYVEFSITPLLGFEFSVTTISLSIGRNANGLRGIALRSSLDGYTTNIDGIKTLLDITTNQVFSFSVSHLNNTSAITYRLYGYSEAANGQGRIKGADNDILVYGNVASITPVSCVLSDDFTGPSVSGSWTDVGGNSSIVSDRLSMATGGVNSYDYIYQNVNTSYNTVLSTLSNPITWEFNMRQSRNNPQGFSAANHYGHAFIIGGTSADATQGNGYAVVFGEGGVTDDIRLVSYTNGLNGALDDIIAGVTDYGTNYLSIRVTYNPASSTWELFVRDDGLIHFSSPVSIDATDSVGTVVNTTYTSSYLNYIAAVFKHNNGANPTTVFDNLCISTSFDCSDPAVTWTIMGGWSPNAPSINTPIILADDYDTLTGDLIGCSLTVDAGATLTISNNTFVEIQNNVTVNGSILVEPQGAFVQNNNIGTVSVTGTIEVEKLTAPMDAWYEYTYWSPPVFGALISDAIPSYNPSRTYVFDGQSFLDATQESGNNNAVLAGQDDIDDDGDDWIWVNGTSTTMQPGLGYATTATAAAYNSAPGVSGKQLSATFTGAFNNGIYTVPIYRNDSEVGDNNWNLIGNPYPSAIDVDSFLAANSEIDETDTFPARSIIGAIYLWSHDTPPSAIANGNQDLNFSDSDYAIINGVTQIAGGDGVVPAGRKIPSGQAFFVSYSDLVTPVSTSVNGDGHNIAQGNVAFNNSMRTTGATDNSQFFKNLSSKKQSNSTANKLWVNLTSGNNVFNQIAIAYVDGATDNNDGAFYDTKKPAGIVTGAILYSNIEGSHNKFGIQSKASYSLDEDETISLGFKSNMGTATLFKLSIDHLEGDFLTENTVYLKDNLLNKLHNLSVSDYRFMTEVGEFNNRFEIVFNANALSTNEVELNTSKFSIVDFNNDTIQFNTNSNLNIKTILIFDLLGRQLYDLKGQTKSETYTLSNLKNAVYITKIELSNGMVITKKAVKR